MRRGTLRHETMRHETMRHGASLVGARLVRAASKLPEVVGATRGAGVAGPGPNAPDCAATAPRACCGPREGEPLPTLSVFQRETKTARPARHRRHPARIP